MSSRSGFGEGCSLRAHQVFVGLFLSSFCRWASQGKSILMARTGLDFNVNIWQTQRSSEGMIRDRRTRLMDPTKDRTLSDAAAIVDLPVQLDIDHTLTLQDARAGIIPADVPSQSGPRLAEFGESAEEIVFVDAGVDGWESIVAELERRGVETHVLESHSDGLLQISSILQSGPVYEFVYIISHGPSAELRLGNARIGAAELAEDDTPAIRTIRAAIRESGDLLIYGCDLASGVEGREFVESIVETNNGQPAGENLMITDGLTNVSVNVSAGGGGIVDRLTVANDGNQDASSVVITESLHDGPAFDGAISSAGWNDVCDGHSEFILGHVAADDSTIIEFGDTMVDLLTLGRTLVNSASVRDDGHRRQDFDISNNSGTQTTEVRSAVTDKAERQFLASSQSGAFHHLDTPISPNAPMARRVSLPPLSASASANSEYRIDPDHSAVAQAPKSGKSRIDRKVPRAADSEHVVMRIDDGHPSNRGGETPRPVFTETIQGHDHASSLADRLAKWGNWVRRSLTHGS